MPENTTNIEHEIEVLTTQLATRMNELSAASYIREGIVKQAIVSLVWDIYGTMPDCRDALIEALDDWEGVIRDRIDKEGSLTPEPEN